MKTQQTLKRIQRLIPPLAAYFALATAFAAAQQPGQQPKRYRQPWKQGPDLVVRVEHSQEVNWTASQELAAKFFCAHENPRRATARR